MRHKISRQRLLARFSGLLFVTLAFLTGGLVVSVYSFMIAFSFLMLSEIVLRQQNRISGLLLKMESGMRNTIGPDKIEMKRQYMDIFWFYFAFGLILAFVPFAFAYIICIAISLVGMALEITGIGSRRKRHDE